MKIKSYKVMKVVITALGDCTEALFDQHFGRADYFCVVEKSTGQVEFLPNSNKDDNHGAGINVAERMVELKLVKVIFLGHWGPRAKDMLDKFKIQMVELTDQGQFIVDVIKMLKY